MYFNSRLLSVLKKFLLKRRRRTETILFVFSFCYLSLVVGASVGISPRQRTWIEPVLALSFLSSLLEYSSSVLTSTVFNPFWFFLCSLFITPQTLSCGLVFGGGSGSGIFLFWWNRVEFESDSLLLGASLGIRRVNSCFQVNIIFRTGNLVTRNCKWALRNDEEGEEKDREVWGRSNHWRRYIRQG